jgi:hypothetical protein
MNSFNIIKVSKHTVCRYATSKIYVTLIPEPTATQYVYKKQRCYEASREMCKPGRTGGAWDLNDVLYSE